MKKVPLQLSVNPADKSRLEIICARLGLSLAEYLRGAALAQLRRDERALTKSGRSIE